MNGLTLSREYYNEVGKDAFAHAFPTLVSRAAFGLAGEGSECFGFDDEHSRDHDWGPSFCIWLCESDYLEYGAKVQEWYRSLPGELEGYPARQENALSAGRVGCLCIPHWYRRYTGCPEGPQTLGQWRRVPEAFLATATNGEVFTDPLGEFTAIRERLLGYYPEDVRIKKIVARAAVMAQSGQYNYPRCQKRGDTVAAQLALAEFTKTTMSMVYLLNRRYAPFYKWMFRGMQGMRRLPRVAGMLEQLSQQQDAAKAQELIESICLLTAGELRRQELTVGNASFLQEYCADMMTRIHDPELRKAHFMEE